MSAGVSALGGQPLNVQPLQGVFQPQDVIIDTRQEPCR